MPRKFWKSGNESWTRFVLLPPLGLMWLHLAQVSFNPLNPLNTLWLRNLNPNPTWLHLAQVCFNPLNPLNPLWLHNLNPNPILIARERREPLLRNPN